jgi:Mg-chelatase subunit ChlD
MRSTRFLVAGVSPRFSTLLCSLALLSGVAAGCGAGGGGSGTADGSGLPVTGGGVLDPNSMMPGDGLTDAPSFGGEIDSVGCSQLNISFEAQTPTALLVVDRSSSQWENNTWEPMKRGILGVVNDVQADIRVGMVTYTGQNGGACPDLFPPMTQVSFDKNNFPTVETTLNSIAQPAYKGETPTAATIQQALPVLLADASPGQKVMLLVTDGDPDFCNDPDRVCAMDAVVGAVQNAYAQGVPTAVFGLSNAALSVQHLRDVANAGSGQPVALPQGVNNVQDLEARCRNNPVGSLRGTYSPQGGNAQFFQANGTDEVALGQALNAVIYGIRSCIFELDGAVEINPDRVGGARISIDGNPTLVYGDPNGWQLRTPTQIELLGSACQQIRDPRTIGIGFDFPCEVFDVQ